VQPPGGNFHETLAAYLSGRHDDLVAQVISRIRTEVPEYRLLAAEHVGTVRFEADVRSICAAAIQVLTRSDDQDHRLAVGLMRSVARTCLDDGIEAASLRLALRISFVTAIEFLGPYVSEINSRGQHTVATSFFAELLAHHDDLVTTVEDLHTQARLRAPTKDRRLQLALNDLLDGQFYSDSAVLRRVVEAGYDVRGAHGLALLAHPDNVGNRQHVRAAAVPFIRTLPPECPILYRESNAAHLAVLIPSHVYQGVAAAAQEHAGPAGLLIVIAPPLDGPRNLQAVYAQLVALLPILQRLLPACVADRRDLMLYSLIAATPAESAAEYSGAILRGVLREGGSRTGNLIKTLSAYYSAPSKRTAARLLGIGDRTLTYRLARIRELTGLHLDAQRATLELALRLLPLSAPHLRSEAAPFQLVAGNAASA